MNEVERYVKFKDKKATLKIKSLDEEETSVWEINENRFSKEYFVYKGLRYQLLSKSESNKI